MYIYIYMFENDCVVYLTANNWHDIHAKMQADLDKVTDWPWSLHSN